MAINWFQFWRLERQLLGQEFSELAMQILLAGAASGVNGMPRGLDVMVNWDVFNESALGWMRLFIGGDPVARAGIPGRAFAWADRVTDTTRQRVMTEIDNWVRSGDPLRVLEDRLTPLFGEVRGRQIAVTEVTRIYASGNLMAWNASGVVQGKQWRTAVDERVCPICGPMHGTMVEIDGSWDFTARAAADPALAKALQSVGSTAFASPPAHVNCRCWLAPVVFPALTDEEIAGMRFEQQEVLV